MKITNVSAKYILVSIVTLLSVALAADLSPAQTPAKSDDAAKSGNTKNSEQFV